MGNYVANGGGAGGGASFVLGSTNGGATYTLLVAAGGGGGAYGNAFGDAGLSTASTASGGGEGGGAVNTNGGGGGAGFKANGGRDKDGYAKNGPSYAGGPGPASAGFGGGGGSTSKGGGGGGGYTGGNGGYTGIPSGGGTSFLGTLADNTNTVTVTGANAMAGKVVITPTAVCYVSGTLIRTARGDAIVDVAVEDLVVGDLAVTSSGAHRPIRWLGHRRTNCHNHLHTDQVMPVCIAAHAFGSSKPARDLFVSPGHAICVDVLGEVLIPASALVNGSTIQQVEVEDVTYWHVDKRPTHSFPPIHARVRIRLRQVYGLDTQRHACHSL